MFLVVFSSFVTAPGTFAEESYLLGAGDRLKLRIGRWRGPETVYEPWVDVGGEYTVAKDGTLSVPIIGQVPAANMTVGALAKYIVEDLQAHTGIPGDVSVAIEVLEYRPVYVLGIVQVPGAYPFRPGLSVDQAVGLAGGLARSAFGRDAIHALGELEVSRLALWQKMGTLVRLEAELSGRGEIVLPALLEGVPLADQILADEARIMRAREQELENSLSQLADLEALLAKAIANLERQAELRAEQVELAQQDLENANALLKKGLTVVSRLSELTRRVAELQSSALELDTARLTAEQRLNEVGRERLELTSRFRREALTESQKVRGEIGELQARIRTARELFAEASGAATVLPGMTASALPAFWITRRIGDETVIEQVEGSAMVNPGDAIEVRASPIVPQVFPPSWQRGSLAAPAAVGPGSPGGSAIAASPFP